MTFELDKEDWMYARYALVRLGSTILAESRDHSNDSIGAQNCKELADKLFAIDKKLYNEGRKQK